MVARWWPGGGQVVWSVTPGPQDHFKGVTKEAEIAKELVECQGESVDIGGYYHPDPAKVEAVMRPSKAFNRLLDNINSSL